MDASEPSQNSLDRIAEEFVARVRRGERPETAEYVARYPDKARDIEELFPALLVMEQLKPDEDRPPLAGEAACASQVASLGQLGDYRIVREIGRGGMGIVYEAIQESLGRQVALKVLPRQPLSDRSRQARFEREARAAAGLHHTNIVPVFGVGVADGLHFYAMQYIHGLGLDEVLRELRAQRIPNRGASTVGQLAHPSAEPTEQDRLAPERRREFSLTVTQALWQGRFAEHAPVDQTTAAQVTVALATRGAMPMTASNGSGGPDSLAVTEVHSPARVLTSDQPTGNQPTDCQPTDHLSTRMVGGVPSAGSRESRLKESRSKESEPRAAETARTRLSQTAHRSSLHHLGGSSPSDGNSLRQSNYHHSVARIGAQVAEALDYAHEQGILHRDIKPSNLLLDTRGTTWVTDFGLAKADDQENLTHTGDVLGTLRYMAPEMFNGQSDRRSDIYSLGLTLYELLALRPAFDEMDRGRLIRLVLQESPSRLRTLDPTIPLDLETIVHKAIDRDPAHRYRSARELADDLRRYLNDEPILARRASLATRFARWCKRNPAVAGLTTSIAGLLVVATFASLGWLIYIDSLVKQQGAALVEATQDELIAVQEKADAQAAREKADNAADRERSLREEAERQRDRANANFARPRRAVDQYVAKIMADEQLSLPDLKPLRDDLLREAHEFYSEFAREESDDPELLLELAKAQQRLAVIQRELGKDRESREAREEAIRRFQTLHDRRPDDADVAQGLAEAFLFAGRPRDAVPLCEALLQSSPRHPAIRESLARGHEALAREALDRKEVSQALAQLSRAFDIRQALATENPRSADQQGRLAIAANQLGLALVQAGNLEEARDRFQWAAAHPASEAVRLAPSSILWGRVKAIALGNAAQVAERLDKLETSVDLAMQMAQLRQQLVTSHPSVTSLRGEWYQSLRGLAELERRAGLTERAQRTTRAMEDVLARVPRRTPAELFQVAVLHASLTLPHDPAMLVGEVTAPAPEQAQQHGELALEALRQALDLGWADSVTLTNHRSFDALRENVEFQRIAALADSITEANRLLASKTKSDEERLVNQRKAADILGKLAAEHPRQIRHQRSLASTLHAIGMVQMRLKQFEQADQSLEQASDLRRQIREHQPEDVQVRLEWLASRAALGELHWVRAEFPEAHRLWRECLREVEEMATTAAETDAVQLALVDIQGQIVNHYAEAGAYPLVQQVLAQNAAQGRVRGFWRGAGMPTDGEFSAAMLLNDDRESARRYFQALHATTQRPEIDLWFEHAMLLRGMALTGSDNLDMTPTLHKVQEFLAKNPEKHWVQASLAAYEFSQGAYREAAQRLSTHQNAIWGQEAYLLIAVTWKLGDRDQALQRWQRAEREHAARMVELLGRSPLSHPHGLTLEHWWQFAYALSLRRLAAETIAEGATPAPDPWLHLLQAHGYLQIGERDLGLAQIATAMSMATDDPRVQMSAARLQTAAGIDVENVEAIWSRLVELDKNDATPYIQRGRWYWERGERARAEADYARAASLAPDKLHRFLEAGWWVVGPYPNGVNEFGPPEIEADPAVGILVVDTSSSLSDRPAAWRSVSVSPLGQLNLATDAAAWGDKSAYVLTHVYATKERTATLCIAAQSPAVIWINGERAYQFVQPAQGAKYTNTYPAQFPIALRAGVNSILVKCAANAGLAIRLGDHRYDRAMELARFGDWKEAADLLDEELAEGATSMVDAGYLYNRLAMFRYAEGNLAAVRRIYRELKAGLPRPVANYWKYSMVRIGGMAPGIVDDPKELYEWVPAEKSPFNAWQRLLFCWAPYRVGEWRELLDRISIARELDPLDAESSPLEAAAHHHLGDSAKARAAMDRMQTGLETRREGWAARWPEDGVYYGLVLPREAARVVWGTTEEVDRDFNEFYRERQTRRARFAPETYDFDAAVEVFPTDPQLHVARAKRLAELGRFVEADASFRKALELAPTDNEAATARATFLIEMGHRDEAAALFETVLSRLSNNRWLDGVPHDMALRVLREETAAPSDPRSGDPRSSDVFHQLCACYRQLTQGRLDVHSEAFQLLKRQNPYTAACLALLAGDRTVFEQLRAEQTPSTDPYYRTIILALEPVGPESVSGPSLDDLRQSVAAMLAARPNDVWSRRFAALALLREGKPAEARDLLTKSLSPTSQWQADGVVYPLLALAHHHLGERDSAAKWIEKSRWWLRWHTELTDEDIVLMRRPNRMIPRDWLLLAMVYHREALANIEGQATAETEMARLLERGSSHAAETLTQSLKSRLDRLLASGSKDPQPWIERGRWHAEQGEWEKAEADFSNAAALTPNQLNRFLDAGWWVIGPYSKNLEEPCPPEFAADPSRALPVLASTTDGVASRRAAWINVRPDRWGRVDLRWNPEFGEGRAIYACSYVYAPTDQTTWLMIDKKKPLRIWVNGRLVEDFRVDPIGPISHYEVFYRVPVTLRSGPNHILLKAAGSEFTVRIGDTPRDRAVRLFEQDRLGETLGELEQIPDSEEFELSGNWTRRLLLVYWLQDDSQLGVKSSVRLRPWAWSASDNFRQFWHAHYCAHRPTRFFERHRVEFLATIDKQISASGEVAQWPKLYGALIAYRAGEMERARELLDGATWKQQGLPLQSLLALHAGDHERAERMLAEAFTAALDYELALAMSDRSEVHAVKSPKNSYDWVSFLAQLGEAEQALHGNSARTQQLRQRCEALAERMWRASPETWAYDHVVMLQARDGAWQKKHPQPYVKRAFRYAALERLAEAEADFQQALSLAPDDSRVLAAYARFLAERGRASEATAAFAKAHGQSAEHPIALLFAEQRRPDYRRGWQFATPTVDMPRAHHCQIQQTGGVLAVQASGEAPRLDWDLIASEGGYEAAICLRTRGRVERASLSWLATDLPAESAPPSAPIGPLEGDGQWRVYRVSLASPGDLRGLRLNLSASAGSGIEVAWLALSQPMVAR